MKIYNTLTRKKETLKSLAAARGEKLRLFVCGPTVYDLSHIGHARTYIAFDAFVRYLRSEKHTVFYLQNITDVDDKIIQRAKETNTNPKVLAKRFEREYMRDMKAVGILSVNEYARATDYIKEIISQVERLLRKRFAYEIPNDGIYYDISKFADYGKLSKRKALSAEDAVSRIDESVQKRNKGDFALWKFSKPREPKWESPWGSGRPGWHIEDTAITENHFGSQYDIHGGARDLIFPHHEAEISQMEAISGKEPLAKYWMHTGFLTVKGEKMSKSLGNFVTIRDFIKKHSPRILRLLVLKTSYRSPIDYSEKLVEQTKQELARIEEFAEKLRETQNLKRGTSRRSLHFTLYVSRFRKALEDDFNTPKAIAALFDLVKQGNTLLGTNTLSSKDAKAILAFLAEVDDIFGFIFWGKENHKAVSGEIQKLVKEREKHRKSGEWKKADDLRKSLEAKGWLVDDTPSGSRLKSK
ncbi:MAG: cysteine--tRNA ligase [Candidatus Wildermuthbacteria bacterium]|nr:cysteine--tRNA ligase [Candidatus Wildermuthbacteria bacterium]